MWGNVPHSERKVMLISLCDDRLDMLC
uniref:Uncharacterized protein n=1 Tax=Rhizophora mucronata TaxID=61149 RepID=A0A2P2QBL6_RHIMU